MSQRWDKVEARLGEYEAELDSLYRLYHIPVLAVLMLFMLWIRLRHFGRHIGEDGQPLYRGNDPYYHYRTTNYAIQHWPFNMPFDPWTGFDTGTRVGQFGTILDQTVATVALIVGLGSPSQSTIVMVTLLSGPIFATLCAIPMYLIGKRLGGRFGGVVAVLVLALAAGEFLSRSVAGYYGHHVTEVLLTLLALLAGMVMVTVAQRERPIYELVQTREWDAMRGSLKWGAIFGATLAVAIWNWPPAVFLFGVLAAFLFVHLSLEFVRGHSPDHVVIPTVVAMAVAVVLTTPFIGSWSLTPTDISPVQPLMAIGVAAGAVFMAGVARLWDARDDLPRVAYPAGIAGGGLLVVALVAVVLPDLFDFFVSQFERVAGMGATDTRATIGEARAPDNPSDFFFQRYGLGFYTALLGLGLLGWRVVRAPRPRAEFLLLAVFTLFMVVFTLTQIRFDYYMVIGVGAMNAYLVGWIYTFVDLEDVRRDVSTLEPYQVLVVFAILFVIVGPLVVTAAPVAGADRASQPGEIQQWTGSLDWMSENTPEVGAYGTGDVGDDPLEYYGTYENTENFEYRDGEYGVLAWWDYGHFITSRGERIPVANPFQQHARQSADFLLADDEEAAIEALDEDVGEGEGVRYVMVDYQLGFAGTTKYGAPTAFETRHDLTDRDVGVSVLHPQRGVPVYGVHTQRAYESMRVHLYQHHGSAVEPSSLTHRFGEYNPELGLALPPEDGRALEQHDSPEEAAQAASEDPNVVHGGVLGQPPERVEALQHFRLVHASENVAPSPFQVYLRQQIDLHSWVKTFERVEGATIEGTGPADAEVRATVQMEVPTTGEVFHYTQYAETDEDGTFEMVVPYSTTGYDEWGTDEGYTNVDVRANGSYEFAAVDDEDATFWTATADVTEGQVLGEDETVVEVELEEGERPEIEPDDDDAELPGDDGEVEDGDAGDDGSDDGGDGDDDDGSDDGGDGDDDGSDDGDTQEQDSHPVVAP